MIPKTSLLNLTTRSLLLAITTAMLPLAGSAATIAYYRFEEGANGSGSVGAVPAATDTILDSAGGDDNLRAFNAANAPLYVANVPAPVVPLTGAPNALSLDFVSNDDVFTSVQGPLVTGAFTDFTIECFVQFDNVTGFRTMVGRDDIGNPGQGLGPQSLLYFQKGANGFRVEVITATNTNVQVNTTIQPVVGAWNHLAAVGNANAGTLQLFLNGALVGSSTGFTGLFNPNPNSAWTIGRGQFNGGAGDFVDGRIDEVRISDTALSPSQMLVSPIPEPTTALFGIACMAVAGSARRTRQRR